MEAAIHSMPQRRRLTVQGVVQGVGFRPLVYRLAVREGLAGWVRNDAHGVTIEVEGDPAALGRFTDALCREAPAAAAPRLGEPVPLPPAGAETFTILPGTAGGQGLPPVAPDLATCPDCLAELCDPANRRHRYPFIACAHCGPRYTVLEALPYDRERTSLRHFPLCPACAAEYASPADRRFHAQAIACADCGPRLALWDGTGGTLATDDAALLAAVGALRAGRIVALKGLGGFQLLVDARDEAAVARLRERKRRPAKPFALMVADVREARRLCRVSEAAAGWLAAPSAPIVLLERNRQAHRLAAPAVAPGNPWLGVMLPATPLHHLLLREAHMPLVCTSGNRGEEPICTDEREALSALAGIADLWLVHDRPIAQGADDSVLALRSDGPLLLRRARGFVPAPVAALETPAPLLAVGGHLKNTVGLAAGGMATLSPHLGDLDSVAARERMGEALRTLQRLHGVTATAMVRDTHPDYAGTHHAEAQGLPVRAVPHHLAHAWAVLAEHGLRGPVLAVTWDGTGHAGTGHGGEGSDAVWGGEFLRVAGARWQRVAHLREFSLPGGERAIREPRLAALGLLHEMFGADLWRHAPAGWAEGFTTEERSVLPRLLGQGISSPRTSSAGRLFDGLASLLGLQQGRGFEGQAAMALEFAAQHGANAADGPSTALPLRLTGAAPIVLDWEPLVRGLLQRRVAGEPVPPLAAACHESLVQAIVAIAQTVGQPTVVLGGGCWQNRRLLEGAMAALRGAGFTVYRPRLVPPNDGGLALGQLAAAAALEGA